MRFKIELNEIEMSNLLGYDINNIQKSEQEIVEIISKKLNVKPKDFCINRGQTIMCEWSLKLSPTAYEINFTHQID